MSFAAIEQRLNAAVVRHLANATVSIAAGPSVGGIFDNGFSLGGVGIGMAASQPSVSLLGTNVPANPVGQSITVNNGSYVIAAAEPDGGGWTRLLLELP